MATTTITRSADIAVSPEAVWTTMIDSSRCVDWQAWHGGFPDGAPATYATDVSFREVIRTNGQAAAIEWTIEEVDAPRRLVLAGAGAMGVRIRSTFQVEAAADGAHVTLEREFKGAAVVAIKWMLEQNVGAVLEQSLEQLEQLLAT